MCYARRCAWYIQKQKSLSLSGLLIAIGLSPDQLNAKSTPLEKGSASSLIKFVQLTIGNH
jgi:hypothetical protein